MTETDHTDEHPWTARPVPEGYQKELRKIGDAFDAGRKNLSEGEMLIIEKLRLLKQQDPVFQYLPSILAERLDILVRRGKKYNRGGVGVVRHCYRRGDSTAFTNVAQCFDRCDSITGDNKQEYPDAEILDSIQDMGNYVDLWLSCRAAKKDGK